MELRGGKDPAKCLAHRKCSINTSCVNSCNGRERLATGNQQEHLRKKHSGTDDKSKFSFRHVELQMPGRITYLNREITGF